MTTATTPTGLETLHAAADRVRLAERELDDARRARNEQIRTARRTTDHTVNTIAGVAGLSEQAVKAIIAGIRRGE